MNLAGRLAPSSWPCAFYLQASSYLLLAVFCYAFQRYISEYGVPLLCFDSTASEFPKSLCPYLLMQKDGLNRSHVMPMMAYKIHYFNDDQLCKATLGAHIH